MKGYWIKIAREDTLSTKRMDWLTRCMWWDLLRHLDDQGRIECGDLDHHEAAAFLWGCPVETAAKTMAELERIGCIVTDDDGFFAPNYDRHQRGTSADRTRRYRERKRAEEASHVTGVTSRDVTERHTRHRDVERKKERKSVCVSPSPKAALESALQSAGVPIMPGPHLDWAADRAHEVGGPDILVKILTWAKSQTDGVFSAGPAVRARDFAELLERYNEAHKQTQRPEDEYL